MPVHGVAKSRTWLMDWTKTAVGFEGETEEFVCPSIYPVDATAAKSLQSCPTLCNPIDGSPPDSPVPAILQARTLEWAAISFSNAWKWRVKVKSLSRVRLFAIPWTVAYQAPPSKGFSRQECWDGWSFPSPMHACMLSRFTPLMELSQTCTLEHSAGLNVNIYS